MIKVDLVMKFSVGVTGSERLSVSLRHSERRGENTELKAWRSYGQEAAFMAHA